MARTVAQVDCPCRCGAEMAGMVAERERGLRAETLAAAPRTPLDTVRVILAHGTAGRL